MDKEKKRGAGATVLAVAAGLAKVGLDRIQVPPFVGFISLGLAGVLFWFALIQFGLFARKWVRCLGYVAITLVFLIWALLAPGTKPTAPDDSNQVAAAPSSVTTNIEDSPNVSITSTGQHGGITAQSVTINNYFANQPPDEKERWRKYLTQRYPLGWCLLASDGKETYTPKDMSYERELNVTWSTAEVFALEPNCVRVRYPNIIHRPSLNVFCGFATGVERKVGSEARATLGQVKARVELLEDEGSFVVVAIGFREAKSP